MNNMNEAQIVNMHTHNISTVSYTPNLVLFLLAEANLPVDKVGGIGGYYLSMMNSG